MENNIRQQISYIFKKKIDESFLLKIIKQGRNSKVYNLELNNKKYVIKVYAPHQSHRLKREVSFYNFLKKNKIHLTSKLIAYSKLKNIAIFSYIEGKQITKIKDSHILKAANFINRLNSNGIVDKPNYIATDGIREITDHYQDCNKRIKSFIKIKPNSDIEKQFCNFVKKFLQVKYLELVSELNQQDVHKIKKIKITKKNYIVSPSDFGFHNVLERKKSLFFFDFEYSGLDDPVKLICDFIAQPDQLITKKQENIFKSNILKNLDDQSEIEHLINIFLPFHKLKWCCIILNEFRSDKKKIRLHADQTSNETLKSQLIKAKRYYKKHFKDG